MQKYKNNRLFLIRKRELLKHRMYDCTISKTIFDNG